jgi:ferric-dicitrate binding protein FerR (iron transport regulator)
LNAIFAALVVLLAMAASALAQTSAPNPAQSAPLPPNGTQTQLQSPARQPRKPFRAARLTFLTGDVHVDQANSASKDSAVLNMPLVEGAVISTGEDGQAELEFEDGSLVRLTPNSGVSLVKLSVDGSGNFVTRAAITGGLTYLELRAGTKYQYSVDAGGDVITPVENSTVRVDFDESPAAVSVLSGSAHVAANSGSSDVDAIAGQTVRMDAESQGATYLVKQAIEPESWDQWNDERDQAAAGDSASQTAARDQYAGDQGYGWSDLDANGTWYNVPGQGEVWQPNVADDSGDGSGGAGAGGFDPYGYGSWVWTPVGYSWASGYGWGWLPYRCGQWFYWDSFGWGWQPGGSCGVFGFGGFGYGLGGINIHHPPSFWHRPRRPVPGPGPFHPIVNGGSGPVPIAVARSTGGRVTSVKTIAGRTVEPLAPVRSGYAPQDGFVGAGLQRDFPVNGSTHEPVLGLMATHFAPFAPVASRAPWEPAGASTAPRSHMLPATPYSGYSSQRSPNPGGIRPAPISRPAPAPSGATHASSPAASHPSSSHK